MTREKLAEEIAKIYMVDLNKRLEYDLVEKLRYAVQRPESQRKSKTRK